MQLVAEEIPSTCCYVLETLHIAISVFTLAWLTFLSLGQTEAIDYNKIHELCWKIVERKFLRSPEHVLSERSAFKQFLVFNILDIEETSKVEKEEIGIILEKFMHAMGRVWDPKPLHEFCEEEVLTFWQYLECLEKKYIPGNDKR